MKTVQLSTNQTKPLTNTQKKQKNTLATVTLTKKTEILSESSQKDSNNLSQTLKMASASKVAADKIKPVTIKGKNTSSVKEQKPAKDPVKDKKPTVKKKEQKQRQSPAAPKKGKGRKMG